MKNKPFYRLLHWSRTPDGKQPLWTVTKIAAAIYSSRPRVNQTLNNRTGGPGRNHGASIRKKLVAFFKTNFPDPVVHRGSTASKAVPDPTWRDFLAVLEWNERGEIVPHGTLHMEQTEHE